MAQKWRDARTGKFRRPFSPTYMKSMNGGNAFHGKDTLSKGIANFMFATSNGMADHAAEFAQDLLDYAKNNAPWQDQTGDARAGLETEVTLYNDNLMIDLFHTVEYGIWLEIRWGGRYAIIIPTIETMGPKLFDRMRGMLGDIIYYDY